MTENNSLDLVTHTLTQWKDWLIGFIPNIVSAIILLVLFYFLAKILSKMALRIYSRLFPANRRAAKGIEISVKILIWFCGVILALQVLHLASFLTHLLAGAGIVGIIAGFAFKDIASNAFSGLLIKSEQPFDIGDWVNINNSIGKVVNIGLVTVELETIEGETALIPNQLIYSAEFFNYSKLKKRRVILSTGVSYGDDLEKVRQTTLALMQEWDFVIDKNDINFYFTDIGSSTYDFIVRFWVDFITYEDYLESKSQAIMALKKRFEQENISIAYNVTTLDFGVKGGVNLFDKAVKFEQDMTPQAKAE
ncbi:mechanosensitive ion channel family protein [Avibacterium paragallinarum]|uniref:Small-conductance mechanosensitive channel n=1 Tax=Avibacterium paragallinarum TaxID=728 RepID=A0AAE5TJ90_AVIPA|nr:mechanosensitive ion channel [Avibacterium paragallinarum]MEE3609275.1 mechanosensitive ion channel [Avibacterium paragallinarum]MEE3620839.1 mechanosensitive ion channel [Avibacterium paragallinarum]MEE3669027.1 mechanosensitive ion channel [Avibacterium paragallinarum]MEE3681642.1 mechanosensitive ion channel [Avibacterium paragallinarum]MEE4386552.1 mechanosensitive ion channel [Avibacterium paragallinarum]